MTAELIMLFKLECELGMVLTGGSVGIAILVQLIYSIAHWIGLALGGWHFDISAYNGKRPGLPWSAGNYSYILGATGAIFMY